MSSNDAKWVMGTIILLAGLAVGFLSAQLQGVEDSVNKQIDALIEELNEAPAAGAA